MKNTYGPIHPKCPHMLHGADYNPEQWRHIPGIWEEDMRLMTLAHCNVVSVGMFSWVTLEPEEGKYNFEWLDKIMDNMHKINGYVVLATPSGARPAWLSAKYPEVLRVRGNRVRN
ncbi:MAG: beta-galactosidase, partial [Epulopiscium sp.]|nr:beta-galactosidase [Candidatus Epulonipiscium sp.]